MDITALMKDSWRLIWRRKSLLALGFTSVLAASLAYVAIYAAGLGVFLGVPGLLSRITGIPVADLANWPVARWGLPVAAVGVFLWLVLWLVGLAARGGLIALVDESESGKSPTFGSSFGRGLRLAPRLATMAFILFLPVIVLTAIGQIGILSLLPDIIQLSPEQMAGSFITFYAVSLSLSCVIYALIAFLQFIYAFAYRGIVVEERGPFGAIRHGWEVLTHHPGEIVPLAMLYMGILVLLVIAWYVAFFALYIVLLVALAATGADVSPLLLVVIGGGFLVLLLLTFIAGAIQSAWRSAAFTMGYRAWTGRAAADEAPATSA